MNLLIGIITLAILLYFFRHRIIQMSPKAHNRMMKRMHHSNHDRVSRNSRYHAVSIEAPEHCCRHAKSLKAKRFLSNEAPQLPLANCSLAHCQCKYTHHTDRRDKSASRRVDFGMAHELYGAFGEKNRRTTSKGRRSSDMRIAAS